MSEMSPRELILIAVVKIAPGKIRPTHVFPSSEKHCVGRKMRAIGADLNGRMRTDHGWRDRK
jgi:hypothetical protein